MATPDETPLEPYTAEECEMAFREQQQPEGWTEFCEHETPIEKMRRTYEEARE